MFTVSQEGFSQVLQGAGRMTDVLAGISLLGEAFLKVLNLLLDLPRCWRLFFFADIPAIHFFLRILGKILAWASSQSKPGPGEPVGLSFSL